MNTKVIVLSIFMLGLAVLSCSSLQPQPTSTPTSSPTSTPLPTSTPVPPTPTPVPPDISGKVTGKENSFANRYFVLCQIQDSSCVFTSLTATSNSDGYFQFQDVPNGEYYIFYDSGHENFVDAVKKWDGQTIQVGDVPWLVDNYVTHNENGGISFTIVEDTVLNENTAYMMVYRFFATSPFLWAHSCAAGGCSRPENVLPVIASVSNGKSAQVEFTVYGPFDKLSGDAPTSASNASPATTDTAKTIFSDDFNNAAFDGSFNSNQWSLIPNAPNTNAEQADGVLHLTKSSPEVSEAGGIKSGQVWSLNEFSYVEARLKVDEQHEGEMGNIAVGFEAQDPLVGKAVWWAQCGLLVSRPQPYFWCGQESDGEGSFDYVSDSIYVEYGQWYTVRIEFNSQTAELTFYLDGKKIGEWQPANVAKLRDNKFYVVLGSWNDSGTTVNGYMDDFRLVK